VQTAEGIEETDLGRSLYESAIDVRAAQRRVDELART
jgi:hypothetical protein